MVTTAYTGNFLSRAKGVMNYTYNRTASGGTLMAAKLAWAKTLTEAMVAHFRGWRVFHGMTTDVSHGPHGESVTLRFGNPGHWVFFCVATVDMQGTPKVHCHIEVHKKGLAALEDDGDVDPSQLVMDDRYTTDDTSIVIDESAPPPRIAQAVSLWFSKHMNGLVR